MVVVAFIVIRYGWLYVKQSGQILGAGGMAAIYRELIELVCRANPSLHVVQIGSYYVFYNGHNAGGPVSLALTQNLGKLTVEWRLIHPTFGKRTYRWVFPVEQDQKQMYERIKADLEWP
jgi:hypothetical protein